ncbi:hypothetical protein [Zhongshania sp.]|jgi:hypothetical protein|uniref:hypothetical protein n=1 Tax=Zhongshania sp. TaxID=1971902 RepID=UPI0039E2BA79
MSEEKSNITINLKLSQDDLRELNELTDQLDGGENIENEEDTFADKGLRRKRYRITCEARDANGNVVSWVEKAYGSALALAVGAVACQVKVGNPNCSADKL